MSFYFDNLIPVDSISTGHPKLSFKTTDTVYLTWRTSGGSFTLYPNSILGETGSTTTDNHFTIPAGKILKDQTLLIKGVSGDETIYQSVTICIENPELTPTSSIISGAGSGKPSFCVGDGTSSIVGDSLTVNTPTTITGDLTVQAPAAGTSTTKVDILKAAEAHVTGTTHTHGAFRMYGDASTQEFRSDLPVFIDSSLTTVGAINANGGIQVPAINPVSLSQHPFQLILGKQGTLTRILKVFTEGYAIIPQFQNDSDLTGFEVTANVTYPGSPDTVKYFAKYQFFDNYATPFFAGMVIPLTKGASATFTFSPTGTVIQYYLYWMPMGGGGPTNPAGFDFLTPPTGSAEAIEGERIHQEHVARVEARLKRPEKANSFITNLQEAFGKTLNPDKHAALTKKLEELL
ncbi:MAG: hypothetical protein HEP71_33040 [Roseivirga sp.]|nr:hypothetical protein [Roseivirga sp.]